MLAGAGRGCGLQMVGVPLQTATRVPHQSSLKLLFLALGSNPDRPTPRTDPRRHGSRHVLPNLRRGLVLDIRRNGLYQRLDESNVDFRS